MRHRTSARHEVGHHKGNRSGGRGRQGVGGLHTSDDVGEQGHPWTRPSKGGPCRCELLKGPMGNAFDVGIHVTRTSGGSGRHVATSRIGGGAGCGKSARPDLARGRVRVTARPTLQRAFARRFRSHSSGSWRLRPPVTACSTAATAAARPRSARACRGCPEPGRHRRWHHHRRPQPGQQAAKARGSAAVSSSSWPRRLRACAWHRYRRRCAKRAITVLGQMRDAGVRQK